MLAIGAPVTRRIASPFMAIDPDSALDNLAQFVQAVARDPDLKERFRALAKMSSANRYLEIQVLADRMATDGEDAGLVASLRLLSDDRVFAAADAALRDLGCDLQ
jgi:hypothetical protein